MKINKQPQDINNNLNIKKAAQQSPAQAPPKKNIIKQPVDLTLENKDTLKQLPGAKQKPTILDLMGPDFSDNPLQMQTTLAMGEEGGDDGPRFPMPGTDKPSIQTTLATGEEGGNDFPDKFKPGFGDGPATLGTTLAMGEEGGDMPDNWEQKIKTLMRHVDD